MAQQTKCPACGAPIEYSGSQDVIRCGFCGTDLSVIHDGEDTRFQVVGQPDPQKEVLSQPVIPAGTDDYNPPIESTPTATAPSLFDQPTQSGSSAGEPIPAPPPYTSAGNAQVYPTTTSASKSSVPRWIWIVLGAVVGLCVLCSCSGVLFLVAMRSNSGY